MFALSALAKELNSSLRGARIDKIQQPETDELRFYMRANGKNVCLVASCNAAIPRLHITASKKQSPMTAPNFCMLLRKHLTNASVDEIGIYNSDRILYVSFNAKTEMKDDARFYFFVEIMNRYSNIVFTDENLTILEAVKHLPLDAAREHVVMRGVRYSPVIQPKISYLNDCFSILREFSGGDLHKYIQSNISGFSGATVSELLLRAGINANAEALKEDELRSLERVITDFRELASPAPCIMNGEVYPIVYGSLGGSDYAALYPSMSEAYDALNTDIDSGVRNRARLKSLATQASRLRKRVEKNIAIDLERLAECEHMEDFRKNGELIVNNIYKIKRGDKSLVCFDYYENKEVEIPLDPQLSPSKNSAAYYNKYNKLKRTKEFVENKLSADKNLLNYVKSIEEEIASLPFDCASAPIEEELAMLGGFKRKATKGKVHKEQAEPPYVYLVDGFYIYRGKNNLQNDELTFKIAASNDIWLHLKNDHGAHTIIATQGREVPDKVLKIAAEIAASTKQASADVDYTLRRNVKRQPSGHFGQVIYENYQTILANPDAHTEFLIKH